MNIRRLPHPLFATESFTRNLRILNRNLAPIAVFAYRRTDLLTKTLDALERCPGFADSPVFVFSDGPRSGGVEADVTAVRKLVRERLRRNMTLIESSMNCGLAASIVNGVNQLCCDHGRVIVIEDDLIVSSGALTWLNAALDRFADQEMIWQVSAHQWPVPEFASRTEGLFLNLTTSWGWATWKRAWDCFDVDAPGWEELRRKADLRRRFDLDGSYPYSDMLERTLAGATESWAIRFWWSVFCAEGLVLFPPRSLVTNIGFDNLATHYRLAFLRRMLRPADTSIRDEKAPALPARILLTPHDREAVIRALLRSRPAKWRISGIRNLFWSSSKRR